MAIDLVQSVASAFDLINKQAEEIAMLKESRAAISEQEQANRNECNRLRALLAAYSKTEVEKFCFRLEMHAHDDDPGHWYFWGSDIKNLESARHVRDNCWRPKNKHENDLCRIVRISHTKEIIE